MREIGAANGHHGPSGCGQGVRGGLYVFANEADGQRSAELHSRVERRTEPFIGCLW